MGMNVGMNVVDYFSWVAYVLSGVEVMDNASLLMFGRPSGNSDTMASNAKDRSKFVPTFGAHGSYICTLCLRESICS